MTCTSFLDNLIVVHGSCLTTPLRTWPFYLRPEYFITPTPSPQGLPVYAEDIACAYALATSDISPVSPHPQRSFDCRVLSFLDLFASESDREFFYLHISILFIVGIMTVIFTTICKSNDINIFYICFELDCDWSKLFYVLCMPDFLHA
jgi:hypothetical protein